MTTDIGLPQTVAALPAVAARRYGDRPAQRHLAGGVWQDVSYVLTLMYSGNSFRRFHLIIKELFSTGVLSLIIIIVAGLFVGMVLGLQGYETLKRYGSESALGVMVALGLVRELGPVVAALLFAMSHLLQVRVRVIYGQLVR